MTAGVAASDGSDGGEGLVMFGRTGRARRFPVKGWRVDGHRLIGPGLHEFMDCLGDDLMADGRPVVVVSKKHLPPLRYRLP